MLLILLLLIILLLVMGLIEKYKYILKELYYKNLIEGYLNFWKYKEFSIIYVWK